MLVAIYFFGYLLRVSTPQGYSLKVRQHQSSSLLALYLRNPKMKLPKRFNRAEQHLFAKQTEYSSKGVQWFISWRLEGEERWVKGISSFSYDVKVN